MASTLERLAALPLFQGLSTADLEVVLAQSRTRRVPEGGYFFYQEDPAEHIYILTEGRVRLSQVTTDGQQVILRMIPEWEVFGIIAFVEGSAYPATAQATSDCQALSWDRSAVVALSQKFPRLAFNAMGWMAQRLHEFQDRVRELSTERVERRLARLLLRLVRQVGRKTDEGVLIDLTISRQDLAEMSGTTLYTVSRILSQWERDGLIDTGRERVLLRFPHGLVRIAEDLPEHGGSDAP